MNLDQDTLVRLTAEVADSLLYNVDEHIERWQKAGGAKRVLRRQELAPASDLGIDVIPLIAEAISVAWHWLDANWDGIVAGLTANAMTALAAAIRRVLARNPDAVPEDEREEVVQRIIVTVRVEMTRSREE